MGTLLLGEEEARRANAFDWAAEFPEIMRSGGFDAVIGNPPYDVLEKDRGKTSWPHEVLAEYVKTTTEYGPALGGKLNLYRFFIIRSLSLTRPGGRYGMILPLSLIGDVSVARTRLHLVQSAKDLQSDCFPQKDNARRRIFKKAKLSTVVVTCERATAVPEERAEIHVRVFPWNRFTDQSRDLTVRLSDMRMLDPVNLPIPLADSQNWAVCKAVYRMPSVVRLGTIADFSITRGEINQTVYRKYITSDPKDTRLVKGVEIGRYEVHRKLSQGSREWLDERRFLRDHGPRTVVELPRIATQRITGVDERLRIVAALVAERAYFADSTNSLVVARSSQYRPEYVLGLLNSTLFQWRFKLTSTNNNVGTNELEAMPFRRIDFAIEEERKLHEQMVARVGQMTDILEHMSRVRLAGEHEALRRRLRAVDASIDRLVYQLYGVTAPQAAIVERLEALPAMSA
ncbi:MAG: hypothetical protein NVS3B21_34760 [Acidimicrobiales bacterium]